MERLDAEYGSLKKASKDESLSETARAEAATKMVDRETTLMPTFKQIALLYADLHELVSIIYFQGRTALIETSQSCGSDGSQRLCQACRVEECTTALLLEAQSPRGPIDRPRSYPVGVAQSARRPTLDDCRISTAQR